MATGRARAANRVYDLELASQMDSVLIAVEICAPDHNRRKAKLIIPPNHASGCLQYMTGWNKPDKDIFNLRMCFFFLR